MTSKIRTIVHLIKDNTPHIPKLIIIIGHDVRDTRPYNYAETIIMIIAHDVCDNRTNLSVIIGLVYEDYNNNCKICADILGRVSHPVLKKISYTARIKFSYTGRGGMLITTSVLVQHGWAEIKVTSVLVQHGWAEIKVTSVLVQHGWAEIKVSAKMRCFSLVKFISVKLL